MCEEKIRCPICNSTKVSFPGKTAIHWKPGYIGWRMGCDRCNYTGPIAFEKGDAIDCFVKTKMNSEVEASLQKWEESMRIVYYKSPKIEKENKKMSEHNFTNQTPGVYGESKMSEQTKHTPVPWSICDDIDPDEISIYHCNPPFNRFVANMDMDVGREEAEANAHFIISASETAAERDRLEALNAEMLQWMVNFDHEIRNRFAGDGVMITPETKADLKTLIIKAKAI